MSHKSFLLTGDAMLDELIQNYLDWTLSGSSDQEEIIEMAEKRQVKELADVMNNRLTFGTAGIRGAMGSG